MTDHVNGVTGPFVARWLVCTVAAGDAIRVKNWMVLDSGWVGVRLEDQQGTILAQAVQNNKEAATACYANTTFQEQKVYILLNAPYVTERPTVSVECSRNGDEVWCALPASYGDFRQGVLTSNMTVSPNSVPPFCFPAKDAWYKIYAPTETTSPIVLNGLGARFKDDCCYGQDANCVNEPPTGFIALYEEDYNYPDNLRLVDSHNGRVCEVFWFMPRPISPGRWYYFRIGSNSLSPNQLFQISTFNKLQSFNP